VDACGFVVIALGVLFPPHDASPTVAVTTQIASRRARTAVN
jgi:hypothetical protein